MDPIYEAYQSTLNSKISFADYKTYKAKWKIVKGFDAWKREVSKYSSFIDSTGVKGFDSIAVMNNRNANRRDVTGVFFKNTDQGLVNTNYVMH